MSDVERQPLIQRVRVAASHPHKRPHSFARFCGIAIGSTLIFWLIGIIFPILILAPAHSIGQSISRLPRYLPWWMPTPYRVWPESEGLKFDEVKKIILETPDTSQLQKWSEYYTSGPHLAGKNYSQALWTQQLWESFGVESKIVSYDVLLNYPVDHRLALLKVDVETGGTNYTVKFEASLKEDVVKEDGTSGLKDRIPTFHGYSANGNVTAPFVFANYGTYKDYEELASANVSIKGKIVIVKYGRIMRGLKVAGAEDYGAVGCLIYSDPGDDGEITEANGYKVYPDGPARQPSSVQRGSVERMSLAPGDPTTPGYASHPGVPRQSTDGKLVGIPSLPISYLDALPILKALNGYGMKASKLGKYWEGGGLGYKGVNYYVGPSPIDVVLNLYNAVDYKITPLWDVIGMINGTFTDEVVIMGNHRDAWIAGGAGDPNSGSAALNEVVRGFGKALKKGWKPLRSVVFASWDGEEYALIGSTEWVEEHISWLSKTAIAYLNVDVATVGPNFDAGASPLLNGLIKHSAMAVKSVNQTVRGQSIYDVWSKNVSPLGSGSDYTAFLDFAGIPSVDMGFHGGAKDAPYHYHSNFDSLHWMEKYGDPGFKTHASCAQLWGLMGLTLLDSAVLPFNVSDYAIALQGYLQRHHDSVKQLENVESRKSLNTAFDHLNTTLRELKVEAADFDSYATNIKAQTADGVPWWKWWKKVSLYYKVRSVNMRYKYFERKWLDQKGLDGRDWFKHVVFAPSITNGYGGSQFPGLEESIAAKNWTNVEHWANVINDRACDATHLLRG